MKNAYSKGLPAWLVNTLAYGFIVLIQFDHVQLMGLVSPSDVFLVLLFFLLLGAFALSKSIPLPKVIFWLMLLVLLATLGALLSPMPWKSTREAISLTGMLVSFIITYWLLRVDDRWIRRMINAFIVAGTIISVAAWIQWLAYRSGKVIWMPVIYGHQQLSGVAFLGDRMFRATAFYFDPNFLAFYLLTPLIFSWHRFIESKNNIVKRLVSGFAVWVILGAFILTFSRGQFLALLTTVGVGSWFSRRKWRNILVIAFLLTISVVVILSADLGDVVTSALHFNPEAITARLTAWKWGWLELMKRPWLGVGMGVPIFNPDRKIGNLMEEHNAYLQVARGTGFVGLLIFFGLLRRPVINALRGLRYTNDTVTAAYRYAFIALLAGAFTINALLIKPFWIILAIQYVLMAEDGKIMGSATKGSDGA